MSFSDRDALLAAITADPDEDTPRLVYADWLTEHGKDSHAEFIRVQCRLEHVSRPSAEGRRLEARAEELRARLFGHLDALGFAEVTFRRGFVDRVTSGLLNFRDHISHLKTEVAPAYEWNYGYDERDDEELEVDDDTTDPDEAQTAATVEVFARPELRHCVSLNLPCVGTAPGAIICDSKQLVNLRRIKFSSNTTGPGIEKIAAPTFANLRWANFNCNRFEDSHPSIVPLAECPHLANLEYLDFGSNALQDVDAEAVAAARHWNRLRVIRLSQASFSERAVAALFSTPYLPALTELDLTNSFDSVADAYVPEIVDSSLFGRLSKLWLSGTGITDAGAKALATTPGEVRLTRLDLAGNLIGPAGRRALVERFGAGVCVFEGDDQ